MSSSTIHAAILAALLAVTVPPGISAAAASKAQSSVLEICHGTQCTYRTKLHLTGKDTRRLASIMARGKGSAEAERRAVASAIVYFEQRSAATLGRRDTPFSQFKNSRVKGEMDCIDESTNSHGLLSYLERNGLLRHHTVRRNLSRGFIVDNQFPHAAAALRDRKGTVWAVDSWPVPVGAAPQIMTVSQWRRNGDLGREFRAALE